MLLLMVIRQGITVMRLTTGLATVIGRIAITVIDLITITIMEAGLAIAVGGAGIAGMVGVAIGVVMAAEVAEEAIGAVTAAEAAIGVVTAAGVAGDRNIANQNIQSE